MISLNSFHNSDDGQRTSVNTWITSSAIGVSIRYVSSFPVINRTTGALTGVNLSDWDLVVRAWK